LHFPAASHVPEQRPFGSSWLKAAVHVLFTHFWQVPAQSLSTQQPFVGMQVPLQAVVLAAQL
jgi:hypothetical protein